ncbi:TonB-dependent receptor [Reichenbachiella sp. MALMAid0571]|uniref:SusC/RagA family TonB-linked outer membrane protein n=1 Tax=Reichenbachiella sp. MALMAid0571 TaxID=3143939 RepID=UPI0032E02CEC
MKLTLLRLFTMTIKLFTYGLIFQVFFMGFLSAHSGKAQHKKASEIFIDQVVNGLTIKETFDLIENSSELKLSYARKILDPEIRINLGRSKNISVYDILMEISKQSNLKFRQVNKVVGVSVLQKKDLEGNIKRVEIAETVQISGKITDENGEGLPGASIIEKGTANGTTTDLEGNYKLNISEGASLVLSFVGYKTQEIVVGNQVVLDFQMELDAEQLNEVVVIGYGTTKKSDLTGSVAQANLESFKEAPNTNILQSLQGTIPGLNIGQVTLAGQEPSISVRGRTSINGNLNPLVVVDGAIYRGNLNDLNPSDIQSIDVLKDASSKAIYGAQAANGVILVTTVKGRKETAPSITYNTYYSSQSPTKAYRTMNREEILQAARDIAWDNGGYLAPDFTQPNPNFDPRTFISPQTPVQEGFHEGTDTNWFDLMTNNGFINNHQLSVSGGSETSSYFISSSYTKQENWVLNDEFDRTTVRINYDTKVTPWLTIGASTFGSFSDFSGASPSIANIYSADPLTKPRDENGDLILFPNGTNTLNGFVVAEAQDEDIRNNISGLFYGVINIPWVEGLTYRVNYSHNYRWSNHFNSNGLANGGIGNAFKTHSQVYDKLLDQIVEYKKELGKHSLGVTLLAGRNKIEAESTSVAGSGFDNVGLGFHSIPQASLQTISSDGYEEAFSYQMARLAYDYQDKYFVTATVRRDGFSGFAKNKKFGIFSSVGLGWVASKDFNMDNLSIDHLKLRASYGETGNLTQRYQSLARVSTESTSQYVFGDGGSTVNGQTPSSLANPNLSWETTKGFNIGLDFSILDYRINGNIDYYRSTTNDLLWFQTLPGLTGFTGIQTNLGEVANSGLEIILDAQVLKSNPEGFNWDVRFNFSTNNNKVVSLLGRDADGDGKEDDLVASGLFIDQDLGTIFNYEIDGIWQLDKQDQLPPGFGVGTYKIVDTDGDGVISADDRRILGSTLPAYRFGIQNTLSYKNFSLKLFINSIQGGKDSYLGLEQPTLETDQAITFNNLSVVDYWTPANPGAQFRRLGASTPFSESQYFSRSFVRLQDVSLAYNFDTSQAWMQKVGIKNLKLYLSGKNLITLTDWLGWDPETGQNLSRSNNSPVMKSITAGLEIKF